MDNNTNDKEKPEEEREETVELNDDIVPEEDSENTQEITKKLKKKLKECEALKQDYLTGWQKDKADFVNLRKKDEKEKSEFVKFALVRFFNDIISTIDGFDMAMADKKHWEKAPREWRVGIENIHGQLLKTLEKHGLLRFHPLGSEFNPEEHEAVGIVQTEKKEEDQKILDVIQYGYKLEGRVLRTAKVRVGEYNR